MIPRNSVYSVVNKSLGMEETVASSGVVFDHTTSGMFSHGKMSNTSPFIELARVEPLGLEKGKSIHSGNEVKLWYRSGEFGACKSPWDKGHSPSAPQLLYNMKAQGPEDSGAEITIEACIRAVRIWSKEQVLAFAKLPIVVCNSYWKILENF